MNHSIRVHKFEMHLSHKQYALFVPAVGDAFEELNRSHTPLPHEVGFSSSYTGFVWECVAYSESLQNLMEFIGNISVLLPSGVLDEADIHTSSEVVQMDTSLETPEEDLVELPEMPEDDLDDGSVEDDAEEDSEEFEDDEEDSEEDEESEEDADEEEEDDSPVPASNSGNSSKKVFRLERPAAVKTVAPGVTIEQV